MTNKTFFKLRGIISLIAAFVILVGALFIPTVKLTVNESNGLKDNGTFLSAITRIINLEKAHGKSDEQIAAKYGKYLEVAANEYDSLGKNSRDYLLSEIKPAYREWSGSENVDFQNLDFSTFKSVKSETRASFYYYVILSGQKELENLDNPDKLYYVKALEKSGVNISSYKNKIENHIKTCKKELETLIDGLKTIDGNANGFSYSFSAPALVQFVANISEIQTISELFSKENDIYDKNIAIVNTQNSLSDKQLLKLYYETEYENATTALKELMGTLGYDLSNIENDFNDANSQISDAQNLIDEANTEINGIKEQITSIKTLINEKREEIAPTVQVINALQAQVAAKEAPIVALQKDIDEINGRIEDYNSAIEDLKTLLATLGYDVENGTYEDETIINIIQNDIDNKQALIAAAQVKLTAKEQELSDKQNEIQSDINALNIQIAEKQSQIASDNDYIEQQNAQIAEYNAQIAEKNDLIKEKEAFISTASTFHNFLVSEAQQLLNDKKQELGEIQAPINLLRQEIAEIRATVQEYTNTVNHLKSLNTKFDLNVEGEITYAQKLINLFNGKITDYNTEISKLENELREQIATKNGEISSLNIDIDTFNSTKLTIENTISDIENTENNLTALIAEKSAIENKIAENYEKYAAAFNDVSFYFATYYRDTSFLTDLHIANSAELYYELYRGTTHSVGVDIKTLNYLSIAVLFVVGVICAYLVLINVIKTIKLIRKKQLLYAFGINAFFIAMTVWAVMTVLMIMFNALSFGKGSLTVFGWIIAIICAAVIALNSVGKRRESITYTGKSVINLAHIFSVIEIVLLSLALGIFMLGGVAGPFASASEDFASFRIRSKSSITSSFLWAVPSTIFIAVIFLHVLNAVKLLGTVRRNFGSNKSLNQHVSSGFEYLLLIVALICAAIMLVLLIVFAQMFSAVMWKLLAVIALVALTLVVRIIQNKLLIKHFPRFNVNDMREILNPPTLTSKN